MTQEEIEKEASKFPHNRTFIAGVEYAKSKMYSEEDMINFAKFCQTDEFEPRSVNKGLLKEYEYHLIANKIIQEYSPRIKKK